VSPKTILVCGLPGAGKTYFAAKLAAALGVVHVNNDLLRTIHNDWDFSDEGRLRQVHRMKDLADQYKKKKQSVVLDFVCPKKEYRDLIKPDILVWANRTPVRDFPDTTAMFENPLNEHDYWVTDTTDVDELVQCIVEDSKRFNYIKPTALMIGRFQPFHAGHKALFEKALEKHGQVLIGVRSMPSNDKNPFDPSEVRKNIDAALKEYAGKYTVGLLPNIVDVVYGRDVGWTVTKIDLPPEIEAISATQIREAMKRGD
jgi:cytidyltransferase-like protein